MSDIIDVLLKRLVKKSNDSILREHYDRSVRWKAVIQSYIQQTGATWVELAEAMEQLGHKRHPQTIRHWLDEDGSTVGPHDAEAYLAIGLVAEDADMQDNYVKYKESCDYIRRQRTRILNYLQRNQMKQDNDDSREESSLPCDDEDVDSSPGIDDGERNTPVIGPDVSDESIDEVIALSTQDRPSSIGISFSVDQDIDQIAVTFEFATYRPTLPVDCMVPYTPSEVANGIISMPPFSQFVYQEAGYLRLKMPMASYDVTSNWRANEYQLPELKSALYKLAAQCKKGTGFKREPHRVTLTLTTNGKCLLVFK